MTYILYNVTSGGGDVLLYASKYHGIPTIVEASARYDLKGGIEGRLGKDFMAKIKKEGFIDIGNKLLSEFMFGKQKVVICESKVAA